MISELHRQRYRTYYGTKEFHPRPHAWRAQVDALVARYVAGSVLDYGCGPSRSLSKFAPYAVSDYDPAVPELSMLPQPADIVVCNHVLEHVEPDQLDSVFEHLHELTKKAAYIALACVAAPKVLFDGTPWHTIVQPGEWWDAKLKEYFTGESRWTDTEYVLVADGRRNR